MQSLANIIRVDTSKWMGGAWHVACVGINAHILVVEKLKETVHLEEIRVN